MDTHNRLPSNVVPEIVISLVNIFVPYISQMHFRARIKMIFFFEISKGFNLKCIFASELDFDDENNKFLV